MNKVITAAVVAATFVWASPVFAIGNNETPAQLRCSDSAIANMLAKTSAIRGEAARRAALEELASASSYMKAQRRAACIEHVQNAMKFFHN